MAKVDFSFSGELNFFLAPKRKHISFTHIYVSSTESRILLTRDRGLLMRSIVTYGYYVRSTNPQQQILEVMKRFELFKTAKPFDRCIRCK